MNTCGKCHMFKNGCEFSETETADNSIKNFVACVDYIDEEAFVKELSKVEKQLGTGR